MWLVLRKKTQNWKHKSTSPRQYLQNLLGSEFISNLFHNLAVYCIKPIRASGGSRKTIINSKVWPFSFKLCDGKRRQIFKQSLRQKCRRSTRYEIYKFPANELEFPHLEEPVANCRDIMESKRVKCIFLSSNGYLHSVNEELFQYQHSRVAFAYLSMKKSYPWPITLKIDGKYNLNWCKST